MPARYFGAGAGTGGAETQTGISGISASDTMYTSGSVRFTGSQAVTVRSGTGQLVVVDAPAQTVQTQGMVNAISNSQVSRSGTVNLSGAGIVNVGSQTGNAFTISASQSAETGQLRSVSISANASTSGTLANISSGALSLVAGPNITLSQNANTVAISAAAGGGAETQTAISGIAASDTTYTSGTVQFSGVGGGVTVSSNTGQRVDISVAAPGGGAAPTLSIFRNMEPASAGNPLGTTAFTGSHRSVIVQPLVGHMDPFPGNMTVNTMFQLLSLSGSTATMSAAYTSIFRIGLYTNNAGTLSLVNSVSTSIGSGGVATDNSTLYAGIRWLSIHSSAWSAQPVLSNVPYWWATHWSSAGALNQTGNIFGQNFAVSNTTAAGSIGAASVANNTSKGYAPFYGAYSATTAALPVSINSHQLNKQVALGVAMPMVVFNNITGSF